MTINNNGSIVTATCVYALRSKALGGMYKAESVKLRAEVKDHNNCYWDQDIKWEDWRIK